MHRQQGNIIELRRAILVLYKKIIDGLAGLLRGHVNPKLLYSLYKTCLAEVQLILVPDIGSSIRIQEHVSTGWNGEPVLLQDGLFEKPE